MKIYETYRDRLIAIAQESHKDHPQYAGYYEGWQLLMLTRELGVTKGGTVLAKSRMFIGSTKYTHLQDHITIFDPDLQHNVSVPYNAAKFLTSKPAETVQVNG